MSLSYEVKTELKLTHDSFMKTFTALCFAVVLLSIAAVSRAQTPCPVYSTPPPIAEGQEFLLCFMANEMPSYMEFQYQDIYVASLDKPATVRVWCPYLKIDKTFNLGVFDTLTYHISQDIDREEGAIIYVTEKMDSSCIYVSADAPIICYGMNHKRYTADAFLALPRHTADMHYMVMSYPNSALTSSLQERASEFAVAAWEDSTVVTIKPSTVTSSGTTGTMQFLLNQFECVQVQADPFTTLGDLSGSSVTSNKPVAVFGGHERAEVPVGYTVPLTNNTSRDHLAEQLPPTTKWGTKFVTSSYFRDANNTQEDLVRVLVRDNDTRVMIDGNQVALLNAGQSYDKLIVGPALIETTGPALVGMYAHTALKDTGAGDPFLAIVPPVEQFYNAFTFFISDDPVYTDQHVLIYTERSGINGIFLDGTQLPAIAFTDIPGSLGGADYSYADIILTGGVHRLRTNNPPEKGIAIVAYGWGQVDSYGYTAGALLKPTNGIIPGDGPKVAIPRGGRTEPKVYLRNVLNSRLYFDNATIELDDPYKSYTVQLEKNIMLDTRFIEPGQNAGLDLIVTPANTETIRGKMKVEYHSSQYRNLWPATIPFVIEAPTASGVGATEEDAFAVTLHPNPVTSNVATIDVWLEKMGLVSVRLLDATGREVYRHARSKVAAGGESFKIDTRSLPAGVYTCEIALPEQGTTVRKQLVIMK
jgi:hypothetical protein